MNPIEILRDRIRTVFPDARLDVSKPRYDNGFWMLDIYLGERALAVDWIVERGFGISEMADSVYGEGVDEIVGALDAAFVRIQQLLTTEHRAAPPINVLLGRIRERRGVTQQQLAESLGVRQATISGMEHREDIQLSTLRNVVEALGGKLEAHVTFPEGRYTLIAAQGTPPKAVQREKPSLTKQWRTSPLLP